MMITVVLSVQISVNFIVLKGRGLHPPDDLATLAEVLEQFKRCDIVPALCSLTLLEQPVKCYIASNLSGPFQTVFH